MKQTFLLIVLFLLFLSPGCARADWSPETDDMAETTEAACRGDAAGPRDRTSPPWTFLCDSFRTEHDRG